MRFTKLRRILRMFWPKRTKGDLDPVDFTDVPLREGEISHRVKPEGDGLLHEVTLRAMAVCHWCSAPIQKLGDPCPYKCQGYTEAWGKHG